MKTRKLQRRQKRRLNSPYRNFSKAELQLMNQIKGSKVWSNFENDLPKELINDKKAETALNISILNTIKEENSMAKDTNTGAKTDSTAQTKSTNATGELSKDVANAVGEEQRNDDDCPCKKKKVYLFGVGAGVLIVGLIVWYVLKNRS